MCRSSVRSWNGCISEMFHCRRQARCCRVVVVRRPSANVLARAAVGDVRKLTDVIVCLALNFSFAILWPWAAIKLVFFCLFTGFYFRSIVVQRIPVTERKESENAEWLDAGDGCFRAVATRPAAAFRDRSSPTASDWTTVDLQGARFAPRIRDRHEAWQNVRYGTG